LQKRATRKTVHEWEVAGQPTEHRCMDDRRRKKKKRGGVDPLCPKGRKIETLKGVESLTVGAEGSTRKIQGRGWGDRVICSGRKKGGEKALEWENVEETYCASIRSLTFNEP